MNDGTIPQYPWSEGDTVFASALNGAIANNRRIGEVIISDTPPTGAGEGTLWWDSSGTGLYVRYNDGNSTQWVVAENQVPSQLPIAIDIRAYGAKCDGTTDDAAALNAAIAAACALPHGGKVVLPAGRIVIGSATMATVPAGVSLAIEGLGSRTSELYYSNATDGLSLKLANSGALWSGVHLRSFTVTRGPTSPTSANTGINIWVDPAAGSMYNGNSSLRDLVIWGSVPLTNQWTNSLVMSGVSACVMDNITIQANNADITDRGDVLLTLTGPSQNQTAASYAISNSNFVGGSVGVLVNKYVQGVAITNSTIIGQYDDVRCLGVGSAVNHTTTASTTSGQVLHFAAGSLGSVGVGDVLNGTGLASQSRVLSVNNGAGTITMSENVAGTVASGAAIAIQPYYSMGGVSLIGCNMNARHRGVYMTFVSQSGVVGCNAIIHFNSGVTSGWSGIEFNECAQVNAIGNNIVGNNDGTYAEDGILFSATGSGAGTAANTCVGNTIIDVGGGAVWLKGTITNTTISANNITQGSSAVFQDTLGNTILGNTWNGTPLDFTQAGTQGGSIKFGTVPTNAANDAAALAAGVPVGGVYRNASVLMVRTV